MNYFEPEEFECHCGCGRADMDEGFVERLNQVRHTCGFPFVVSSGFRCKEHNDRINGAKASQHLFGKAVDILVYGDKAWKVIDAAKPLGMTGIGISQKGNLSSRFIHLDDKSGPFRMWSY